MTITITTSCKVLTMLTQHNSEVAACLWRIHWLRSLHGHEIFHHIPVGSTMRGYSQHPRRLQPCTPARVPPAYTPPPHAPLPHGRLETHCPTRDGRGERCRAAWMGAVWPTHFVVRVDRDHEAHTTTCPADSVLNIS
jgi:hypothetical protein